MSCARFLPPLAILLALLLSGCHMAQPPLRTAVSQSVPALAAPVATVAVPLSDGLCDLVWRWNAPDGASPEKSEGPPYERAQFQNRLDRFCTDIGIVAPGKPPLPLADTPDQISVLVRPDTPAWRRIRDLDHMLAPLAKPRQITADLHVLEIPEKLARRWGLDGGYATGDVPGLLKGRTRYLTAGTFDKVRALFLSQPGTRAFSVASVTTKLGELTMIRQSLEVSPGSDRASAPATSKSPSENSHPAKADLQFGFTPDNVLADGWPCRIKVEVEVAGITGAGQPARGEPGSPQLGLAGTMSAWRNCVMGRTTFLGTMRNRTRERSGRPHLLSFLTLRWSAPTPSRLVFKDCGPSGNELLVLRYTSPVNIMGGAPIKTIGSTIDWGNDDKEDDDEKEVEAGGVKDSEAITAAARQFLQEFGVGRAHRGKVLALYVNPWETPSDREAVLVCFGPSGETNRRVDAILHEISRVPSCHDPNAKYVELDSEK